jgi:hypothetical protein
MTTPRSISVPTGLDRAELAESLDIRFLVAGRLSPNTVQLRRDRVELAEVLDGAPRSPDSQTPTDVVRRAPGTTDH